MHETQGRIALLDVVQPTTAWNRGTTSIVMRARTIGPCTR
jgi:hypothetical protein